MILLEMESIIIQARESICPIQCIVKAAVFVALAMFVLCMPLGDPFTYCDDMKSDPGTKLAMCCICDVYLMSAKIASKTMELAQQIFLTFMDVLHQGKLKFYTILEMMDGKDLCRSVCSSDTTYADALQMEKDDIDKVLEDEITRKLGADLLQSVERKFQVDLESSVDMVLMKIKLLLQNGTQHIQDKLVDIQGTLNAMKSRGGNQVESCLIQKQNETSSLAEKSLHQMVVCGYALIGQDPAQAVQKVVTLKSMIKTDLKPLHEQKKEIYALLKVCGHDHDSLKKVIKCVISKSPLIKSVMMEITGKLINGVVDLTKLMAHGAMHEACLIEVVKSTEDEAIELLNEVRKCVFGDDSFANVENYIAANNATVLDIPNEGIKDGNMTNVKEMQDILRRMLEGKDVKNLNETIKNKLLQLQNDLKSGSVDTISNNLLKIVD